MAERNEFPKPVQLDGEMPWQRPPTLPTSIDAQRPKPIQEDFDAVANAAVAAASEVVDDELRKRLGDPLFNLAVALRDLPAHEMRKFCRGMHRPDMQDTLIDWSLAYIKGEELPAPPKIDRRV